MVKENRDQQRTLPPHQRVAIDAEDLHLRRAEEGGQTHLAEVKSKRGEHIQIAIEMMHHVKTPQLRGGVIQAMPPPQRVIEQEDRRDEANWLRQVRTLQQAATANAIDQRLLQRGSDDSGDPGQGDVMDHPWKIWFHARTQRTTALSDRQRDEGAYERLDHFRAARRIASAERAMSSSLVAQFETEMRIAATPRHVVIDG